MGLKIARLAIQIRNGHLYQGKKGKGGDEDAEPGWKMPESEFKTDAEKELEEYEGKWRRRNEQHNFQQRHDAEIIKEEKMIEVEDAVRLQEWSECLSLTQPTHFRR